MHLQNSCFPTFPGLSFTELNRFTLFFRHLL
uniref:Uncharacterized protein n=1 Tax=Siphoviridae sp. ctwQg18 TaxID=2826516 RepID=A0A8S5MJD1_9CAUD|nr:MAG TPA: hypothetical protein [Siphoviridae sp. ctwQg18]DAD82236.1 MAG TPA: hypothetical protein [Siphoviridae sp. ctwQg18]DAI92144.1 MAG TPA: hypothetical protein [Caudoviricetes sp.]DAR92511.1 MAG TPA: hypothetical protein [Bacteriophage sp.]